MRGKDWIILLVFVLIVFDFFIMFRMFVPTGNVIQNLETANVTRIIDGDTMEVNLQGKLEKVRFLGINAPEKDMAFYDAGKQAILMLEGKEVQLEKEKDNRDKYDRLLRYVFYNGKMINEQLVKSGFAFVFLYGGKYDSALREAQDYARENKLGVWSFMSHDKCARCVVIDRVNGDAPGDDCKNPAGEYVVLKNKCDYLCSVDGWQMKDEANHFYTFSKTISAGSELKLHSGQGTDTEQDVFWQNTGACQSIWGNVHDTAFLRDSKGAIVAVYAY